MGNMSVRALPNPSTSNLAYRVEDDEELENDEELESIEDIDVRSDRIRAMLAKAVKNRRKEA